MTNAILRIFKITIIAGICTLILIFALRNFGLSQSYAEYDHKLLNKNFLLIAKASSENFGVPLTKNYFEALDKISNELIIEIPIQLTKDAKLLVIENSTLMATDAHDKPIFFATKDEIQEDLRNRHDDGRLEYYELSDLLEQFPKTNFLINILDTDPAKSFALNELLKNDKTELKERIIIYSKYPEPIRFVKRDNPFFVYSMTKTDFIQAAILDSLYLETIARFNSDLVISTSESEKLPITQSLISEIGRRKKKYILQTDKNIAQIPYRIHGVMTNRPNDFLNYLKK